MITSPGIYPSCTWEDYLAIPAVSRSQLTRLYRSPAAFRWQEEHPETEAMKFGTAMHAAIFEPAVWSEYVVKPNFHGGMKSDTAKAKGYAGGKDDKAKWEAENDGKWVEQEEHDTINAILRRVMEAPAASALLRHPKGDYEVTIVWEDPLAGILCKARLDGLIRDKTITVVDAKSTYNVAAHAFASSYHRYKWFLQDAFYRRGVRTLLDIPEQNVFGDGVSFIFVCFEKDPPHLCRCYEGDSEARQFGDDEITRLLRVVQWCRHTGRWPAYDDAIERVSLPVYRDSYEYPPDFVEVASD